MIYVISKSFFAELKKTCQTKEGVISYMNQTFGLIQEVTELRLI